MRYALILAFALGLLSGCAHVTRWKVECIAADNVRAELKTTDTKEAVALIQACAGVGGEAEAEPEAESTWDGKTFIAKS